MPAQSLDPELASRFANLALDCVHREYPNKIAHVMQGDADARPPRELTPAFYGCFDWHSAVHGHWLLTRLLRTLPDAEWAPRARAALDASLTPEHLLAEVGYLQGADRASWERPYGLAWLLQLAAELHGWDDPDARRWAHAIEPLEDAVEQRLADWLPKLTYPNRSGEHSQTAFAFGLVHDWAVARGRDAMRDLIEARSRTFHLGDRGWNLQFEPSGQDFLSPGLAPADLMRRLVPPTEFAAWLGAYLPGLPLDGSTAFLRPAVVSDKSDGKLAHLDGLNLSRAWMLMGIAQGLPADDPRRAGLLAAAAEHRAAGLAAVTGEHYAGGHWLGSFAVYLVTERGLR
ncbi:MAG: DUF2891 domain-containing protein [Planctomycetes bacterium]|nr:DUF2891 domain-containing protein [Planctomycetota bacterium]